MVYNIFKDNSNEGKTMNGIIDFIKDLLMLKKEDKSYVGLAWLTKNAESEKIVDSIPKKPKSTSEIKISDLMRRAG